MFSLSCELLFEKFIQVHEYLRLIIIMVTVKITQINFHLTSRLLLHYISVIKVNVELKAEGEAHCRVQLTLHRPLSFIFEEVVGKLSASIRNNIHTSQR